MKKKIYLAPDIEVVDVEMETILAGSGTQSSTGGTIGGDDNDGDDDIKIEYPDDFDPFA